MPAKGKPAPPPGEVVCEPGRHVNCLHAKMAQRRKAKPPQR